MQIALRERERHILYRRLLLELWAMFLMGVVVGFMGPFGTYGDSPLMDRIQQWWILLMGAYMLLRPAMALLSRLAEATLMPERRIVTAGIMILCLPLAYLWRVIGQNAYRELESYAQLVPFSLLCGFAVYAATLWARQIDRSFIRADAHSRRIDKLPIPTEALPSSLPLAAPASEMPRLHNRLRPSFALPVIALQSEDHYVRVHGAEGSELLLMRLREAISEMEPVPGEQVHRSWWVARSAVQQVEQSGRVCTLILTNGVTAPVSRDAVYRLRRSGFLPQE